MSIFSKYKAAYGKAFNEEMCWDIALRDITNGGMWKIIPMTSSRYWGADPFLWHHEDKLYLFYERYDCQRNIGELAVREVNSDLSTGQERCILCRPYHLSFPNVFEYKGEFFLIPETSANRSIEVYRAISFPDKWELYKTIVSNISAVDTIIFSQQDDRIILLTSFSEGDACRVENWLLYLDEKFNLIRREKYKDFSDYGNRNAGKILQKGSESYRIGQDCRCGEYGKGLVYYLLNAQEEKEVKICVLKDFGILNAKYDGIHTYNEHETIQTIDLRYKRKRSLWSKLCFLIYLGKAYVKRSFTR